MPFTAAHAIVGLPLAGRRWMWLPETLRVWMLTALVAGAMVPDAPLFLDVVWPGTDELAIVTHRWASVFTVDLLLVLVFVALWIVALRGPWLAALPRRVLTASDEGSVASRPGSRGSILGAAAALVGAAGLGLLTHLLWDSVTHLRGGAVQAWSFLREPVVGVPLYKVLQHGSSVAGVAILGVAAVVWWRRARPVPSVHLRSLCIALLAGTVVGLVGAVLRIHHDGGTVGVYSVARLAATYPVLGAVLALVVWAVLRTVLTHGEQPRVIPEVRGAQSSESEPGPTSR